MKGNKRRFKLDAKALAQARASDVLALSADALGKVYALAETAPITSVSTGGVAVVSIMGPLAQRGDQLCGFVDGYDMIEERVCAALDRADCGAVLLVVDSPGGDVAGLEEAIGRMVAVREDSGKQIFAYVDERACSAAYWLCAALADGGIFVPASGSVGSIGCIAAHWDESKALEAAGLTVTLVRDPQGKAAGDSAEPLNDTARARIEGVVRAAAARFIDGVAETRGLGADAIRGFDGATFAAKDAVANGLADGVASLDEVMGMAAKAASKGSEMKLIETLRGSLRMGADATEGEILTATLERIALGDTFATLTGEKSSAAAEGVVMAWKNSHGRVEALTKEQATREQAAEATERRELVRGAVLARKVTPGEAWATKPDAAKGIEGEIAAGFAEMKLGTLRAHLGALTPKSFGKLPEEPPAGMGDSDDDVDAAKRLGVKVESLRAARRDVQTALARGGAMIR